MSKTMTPGGGIRVRFGRLAGFVLLVLGGAGGCASTAREVGAAATPVVVNGSLHEANQPDDQQQLQRLADSPALQAISRHAGEGVAIGLFNQANKLAGLDDSADAAVSTTAPTTTSTTGPTTTPAAKTPGGAALTGLVKGGGLNGFVKSSVQEAFLAATDPQFKAGEEAMSEAVGEGFVKGMITVLNSEGPALGDTIRKQLGPIVQELIREQIAPAVRDMLQQQLAPAALQVWKEGAAETLRLTVRPDLQGDVVQNAQNISIGAGRGTHQDLVESGFLTPTGQLHPLLKAGLWAGGILVSAILVALLCLLLMLNLVVLHHWRTRAGSGGSARHVPSNNAQKATP